MGITWLNRDAIAQFYGLIKEINSLIIYECPNKFVVLFAITLFTAVVREKPNQTKSNKKPQQKNTSLP